VLPPTLRNDIEILVNIDPFVEYFLKKMQKKMGEISTENRYKKRILDKKRGTALLTEERFQQGRNKKESIL